MPFSVTVQPSGHRFEVGDDETVLAAGLRAGIGLPYGCKNGACGSCKGRVVEGRVRHDPHQATALSAEEEARGLALFCSARPDSDLVIEVREVRGIGEIPIKKLPARVASLARAAADVAIVRLQLPAAERLQYLPGQYVEIILKDGRRRSYSIAGAPGVADQMELHIRHMPGGVFSDHVFGAGATQMKERDILRFEGPLGSFFLRDDSSKPIVLVASGTGFAPIKAIVETAVLKSLDRPITLYWGGRRPHDLYLDALARGWEQVLPAFRYVPVISDAVDEDGWQGRSGFVHRAVLDDFADLSGHQVYACGAPVMVDAARRDFVTERGLPEDEFFADAFTTAADATAAVVDS
ncbi:MAG: CDP-6-deoxy-delta-3,4-glucoseen reductase [Burkholderiaceae bacterium]